MIISSRTDESGYTRVLWEATPEKTYVYKFKIVPTEERLKELGEQSLKDDYLNAIQPLKSIQGISANLVRLLENKFKQAPQITSAEYNAWLSAFTWAEETELRTFVLNSVQELVDLGLATISGSSENAHMQALRDFINSSEETVLNKLFNG
jgi:hypothetical protein